MRRPEGKTLKTVFRKLLMRGNTRAVGSVHQLDMITCASVSILCYFLAVFLIGTCLRKLVHPSSLRISDFFNGTPMVRSIPRFESKSYRKFVTALS